MKNNIIKEFMEKYMKELAARMEFACTEALNEVCRKEDVLYIDLKRITIVSQACSPLRKTIMIDGKPFKTVN